MAGRARTWTLISARGGSPSRPRPSSSRFRYPTSISTPSPPTTSLARGACRSASAITRAGRAPGRPRSPTHEAQQLVGLDRASDTGDHLRPFLQHRGMAVTNVNRKVGVACTLQLAQPFAKRRPGAGDGHSADQLGGANLMLLRAQEHQVAAVVLEVARIGRLVALVDLPILLHQRLERRRDAAAEIAELFALDQVVQGDGRVRAGLRTGARAVERLTIGQHAAAAERRDDSRCRVDAG